MVIQSPSSGQQSLSVGNTSDIFPVHEHFSTDTPIVPKSIIVNRMVEDNMFVAFFISDCKNTKKRRISSIFGMKYC